MSTPLTLLRHGVDIGRVVYGLHAYRRSGEATEGAWRSLLSLHCRTNGRSSDWFAKIVRRMRPPRAPTLVSGIVGSLSVAQQGAIAAQIAKDGYYVFDRLAPREYCDEIERFARTTPAIVEGRGGQPDERAGCGRQHHQPHNRTAGDFDAVFAHPNLGLEQPCGLDKARRGACMKPALVADGRHPVGGPAR